MRNSGAQVILFCAVCCTSAMNSNAQFIDNKINFYGGIMAEKFHGSKLTSEGNFNHPSLMANLTKSIGLNCKVVYKVGERFGVGVLFAERESSGWRFDDRDSYTGSTLTLKSLSPLVQLRTKASIFKYGEIRGVIEMAPTYGAAQLALSKPIFEIQNGSQPTRSNDNYLGIAGSLGCEIDISQAFGFFVSYSYQYSRITSALYSDRKFQSSSSSVGFSIKFMKDKHYFYSR